MKSFNTKSKFKVLAKSILITIIALMGWNFFTDWYLSKVKEPISTYSISLNEFPGEDKILEVIAENLQDKLGSQIIIASPQRISPLSIAQIYFNLPRSTFAWIEYFRLNLDLINYLFRRFNQRTPYGGFILFDYNVGNYSINQYKNYTEYLRKIYRVEIDINFNDRPENPWQVVIYPWIVADCNIMLTEQPYCRNFKVKELTRNFTIEEIYSEIGLDSSLAPVIDKVEIENTCSQEYPILQKIVKNMYSYNQLPVLKHFLYNSSIKDSHESAYRDYRSLDDIKKDSHCYKVIDDLGIPFAIMPSHFYLNAIDDQFINTKSNKFQKYIRNNFKNAYTISDEISMKGYSLTDDFSKRVSSNSSDLLLVHGGTVKFWKRWQILNGVKQIEQSVIINKIIRALELKNFYGLIQFSDRNGFQKIKKSDHSR